MTSMRSSLQSFSLNLGVYSASTSGSTSCFGYIHASKVSINRYLAWEIDITPLADLIVYILDTGVKVIIWETYSHLVVGVFKLQLRILQRKCDAILTIHT